LVNELYAFCGRPECGLLARESDEVGSVGVVERTATIEVVKEAVDALVRMISPFAPHMAEELWQRLGHTPDIVSAGWPTFDDSVARAEEIVVPVQVNGKVRGRVTVPANISEERLREVALAEPQVAKYLTGKTVKKVVAVNGRMVSIVTD
jgi:leucyl-tRNA synthetase